MLYKDDELKITVQVLFKDPWYPEFDLADDVGPEKAHEFRLYNDGIWEFLNENEQPIFQGMHGSLKREQDK